MDGSSAANAVISSGLPNPVTSVYAPSADQRALSQIGSSSVVNVRPNANVPVCG